MPTLLVHELDAATNFGGLLRAWRDLRKHSQLELALEAGVSQRHLSFLESGRAQPSREMILQLATALKIPLRERNLLLRSAGFAALYQERSLANNDMLAVRQALEMSLRHHEPYPAVVMNRQWELQLTNQATDRFLRLLGDPADFWPVVDPTGARNVMRLIFHPNGLRPLLKNWNQVEGLLLAYLQREISADPTNQKLLQLLRDLKTDLMKSTTGKFKTSPNWNAAPPPIVPLELGLGDQTLKLFSMISTFGTALDITAEELRVETFFPADDFSEQFLRNN